MHEFGRRARRLGGRSTIPWDSVGLPYTLHCNIAIMTGHLATGMPHFCAEINPTMKSFIDGDADALSLMDPAFFSSGKMDVLYK